jgi:hypothetical protein
MTEKEEEEEYEEEEEDAENQMYCRVGVEDIGHGAGPHLHDVEARVGIPIRWELTHQLRGAAIHRPPTTIAVIWPTKLTPPAERINPALHPLLRLGPDGHCSPSHRMPFTSRHKGSKACQ